MEENNPSINPVQPNPQTNIENQAVKPETTEKPPEIIIPKKNLKILILVVVFILLSATLGFFIYQNNQLRKSIPQNSPIPLPAETPMEVDDPTTDWKIYTNTIYGFTLKYPEIWNIYETESVPNLIGFSINPELRANIWIQIHENKENLSAEEWWKLYITTTEDQLNLPHTAIKERKTFNGYEGYLVIYPGGATSPTPYAWTYLVNDGKTYEVWVNYEKGEEIFLIYNQILSTFKFTDESADEPVITTPLANSKVASPLTVKGTLPAGWMFEGSSPIKLVDADKKLIVQGRTTEVVSGSWTSGKSVEFTATLSFSTTAKSGFIILENDNPSGLPQNAKTFEIPVNF